MKAFILGAFVGAATLVVAGYLFVTRGGLPMAARGAKPLPLEEAIAGQALRAAVAGEAARPSPIPADEVNLVAGAETYRDVCMICHGGLAAGPPSIVAAGMFPPPPRLLRPGGGVAGEPVGATYWKVKHGIRLTGMPGFEGPLTEQELWQVSLLVANADRLPEAAKAVIP